MMGRSLVLASIFRRNLHVVSRSKCTIKPASPTPLMLKRYNLSSQDRMIRNLYMPIILFYPPQQLANTTATTISNILKTSLSQTLSKYYPFAGRLRSGSYIDCNDEGIDFVEAKIGNTFSDALEKEAEKSGDGLGHLFQNDSIWDEASGKDPSLLLVQLNHFHRGGIAVAVSLSHRVGDACTLSTFITYWANLTRHSGDHCKIGHLCPHFNQLHPFYEGDSVTSVSSLPKKYWITKEIVFHNSNIKNLKAKMDYSCQEKYTRNELVTALLYKSIVAAKSDSGVFVTSVLSQAVNIRSIVDPPLPLSSVGNLFTINHIPTSTQSEMMLHSLVERMRNGKMKIKTIKSLDGNEVMPILIDYRKRNCRVFSFTSMCNFPIYDVMDFGWDRPVKVTIVDTPFADCIVLMDTPSGDGIKAIVSLEEEAMRNFQEDEELLTYASF
ncbi:acyltransferase-like [Apium graveolens]|uniref:acyltransferase-like n=1 Tax=Apium graveolens TaxID=4045 RepID=UPI003D7A026E